MSQTSTEAICPSYDNAFINAKLFKCHATSAQLGDEIFAWNCDFTVLVATLLRVRNLVFDLQAASTSQDQFLCEQISGMLISEAGINISNNRNNVAFECIDAINDFIESGFG